MIAQFLGSPFAYNTWSRVHFRPRCRAIAEAIGRRKLPRILDLGCGTGLPDLLGEGGRFVLSRPTGEAAP